MSRPNSPRYLSRFAHLDKAWLLRAIVPNAPGQRPFRQTPPILQPLEAKVMELDAFIQAKSREQGQVAEFVTRISKWSEDLRLLSDRRLTADREFGAVTQVSNVVSGQNALGVTLQRYVLGALLDEVLVTLAASHRLRAM